MTVDVGVNRVGGIFETCVYSSLDQSVIESPCFDTNEIELNNISSILLVSNFEIYLASFSQLTYESIFLKCILLQYCKRIHVSVKNYVTTQLQNKIRDR